MALAVIKAVLSGPQILFQAKKEGHQYISVNSVFSIFFSKKIKDVCFIEYQCCFGIVSFINTAIRAEATLARCIHMDNDVSVAVCSLFAPLRRRS